jgi:hypothetical protein
VIISTALYLTGNITPANAIDIHLRQRQWYMQDFLWKMCTFAVHLSDFRNTARNVTWYGPQICHFNYMEKRNADSKTFSDHVSTTADRNVKGENTWSPHKYRYNSLTDMKVKSTPQIAYWTEGTVVIWLHAWINHMKHENCETSGSKEHVLRSVTHKYNESKPDFASSKRANGGTKQHAG